MLPSFWGTSSPFLGHTSPQIFGYMLAKKDEDMTAHLDHILHLEPRDSFLFALQKEQARSPGRLHTILRASVQKKNTFCIFS